MALVKNLKRKRKLTSKLAYYCENYVDRHFNSILKIPLSSEWQLKFTHKHYFVEAFTMPIVKYLKNYRVLAFYFEVKKLQVNCDTIYNIYFLFYLITPI